MFSQGWQHVQDTVASTGAPASSYRRMPPLTTDQEQYDLLPRDQRTHVYKFGKGFRVKVNVICPMAWLPFDHNACVQLLVLMHLTSIFCCSCIVRSQIGCI